MKPKLIQRDDEKLHLKYKINVTNLHIARY